MMQSIFEELYNSERNPNITVCGKNYAYQKAISVKNSYKDKLTATLSESQKEMLERNRQRTPFQANNGAGF